MLEDVSGIRIGKLTIINRTHKNSHGNYYVDCMCDCGTKFNTQLTKVRRGDTKSCGCIKERHSLSTSRIYRVRGSMIHRCANKNNKYYKYYGGRGIKVCERRLDFKNFYVDMGERPEGLTIDRIDVNGHYCKENCRRSTWQEQANNKRCSIKNI